MRVRRDNNLGVRLIRTGGTIRIRNIIIVRIIMEMEMEIIVGGIRGEIKARARLIFCSIIFVRLVLGMILLGDLVATVIGSVDVKVSTRLSLSCSPVLAANLTLSLAFLIFGSVLVLTIIILSIFICAPLLKLTLIFHSIFHSISFPLIQEQFLTFSIPPSLSLPALLQPLAQHN